MGWIQVVKVAVIVPFLSLSRGTTGAMTET